MSRKSGFLLVEIIVAISVVAITLGAVFQVISHSLQNANAARNVQLASYLAESKIWDALWQEPVEEGWQNGDFPDYPGKTWSREIKLLYRPSLEDQEVETRNIPQGGSDFREKLPLTDLFQIRVYVNWMELGEKKNFELTTYKLAPTPEADEE